MPLYLVVRRALAMALIGIVVVLAGLWLGVQDPQAPPSGFSSHVRDSFAQQLLACDDDKGDDVDDDEDSDDSDNEEDDDQLA